MVHFSQGSEAGLPALHPQAQVPGFSGNDVSVVPALRLGAGYTVTSKAGLATREKANGQIVASVIRGV